MDPARARGLAKPVLAMLAMPALAKPVLATPAQGRSRRSESSWAPCPLHPEAYPFSWVQALVPELEALGPEALGPEALEPEAREEEVREPLVPGPLVAQVLSCEALCPSPPEVCPSFLARWVESRQCPFSYTKN